MVSTRDLWAGGHHAPPTEATPGPGGTGPALSTARCRETQETASYLWTREWHGAERVASPRSQTVTRKMQRKQESVRLQSQEARASSSSEVETESPISECGLNRVPGAHGEGRLSKCWHLERGLSEALRLRLYSGPTLRGQGPLRGGSESASLPWVPGKADTEKVASAPHRPPTCQPCGLPTWTCGL